MRNGYAVEEKSSKIWPFSFHQPVSVNISLVFISLETLTF